MALFAQSPQGFASKLNQATDTAQNIVLELGTVKEDLTSLLNSIDQYRSNSPELYGMQVVVERCVQDTVQAQTTANTLRSKHGELSGFFTTQLATNNFGRTLISEIEQLYAVLSTWVSSIQASLNQIDRIAKVLPKPSKFWSWCLKPLGVVRDLCTLVAAGAAFIPEIGLVISASFAAGASAAAVAHNRISQRISQYSNLQFTVAQTTITSHNTLNNVQAANAGLRDTTFGASSRLDRLEELEARFAQSNNLHLRTL